MLSNSTQAKERKFVVALTGPIGGGCTTVAKIIKNRFKNFEYVRLSKVIEKDIESDKGNPESFTKAQKQQLGNQLRKEKGEGYLVRKALELLKDESLTHLIVDGIRNPGEIHELSIRFADFYLLAVDAAKEVRWGRLKETYKGNQNQFDKDDWIDQDQPFPYGQKVQECVDLSDILIMNEKDINASLPAKTDLEGKIADYINLILSPGVRPPNEEEILMNGAYDASLRSSCLRRQVGAVIGTENPPSFISIGWNDVPEPDLPCKKWLGYCWRHERLNEARKEFVRCPKCGEEMDEYKACKNTECGLSFDKDFFPGKGLEFCRAIHAEERALLALKQARLERPSELCLYTTTFPCNLCAKMIVNERIKKVVYAEPYPGKEALELFRKAGVDHKKFEGVKASAFYKLFRRKETIKEKGGT